MGRKIRVTIHISRYQREKELGDMYRKEALPFETFTEFRKRTLKMLEEVENINKTITEKKDMTLGSEKTFKKASKKKITPKSIDRLQ